MKKLISFGLLMLNLNSALITAQSLDSNELTLERIFNTRDFSQENLGPISWYKGGDFYVKLEENNISGFNEVVAYETASQSQIILASDKDLTPADRNDALSISSFQFSPDDTKMLIFTNTRPVWRTNTRGDYWLLDMETKSLNQLGKGLPSSSLMFAEFSPNGDEIAYVSEFNLYTQKLKTNEITQLTYDGTNDIINGTFDWVYEEEFFCNKGFKWGEDGNKIAFWQLDATGTKNFSLINNTDSIYPTITKIQYPKVGEDPSSARIGVVNITTKEIKWMNIPGDTKQSYIPRMQWMNGGVLVQQISRKQNLLNVFLCNPDSGNCNEVYSESDEAWVDIINPDLTKSRSMTDFLTEDESFFRVSEKGDWRHVYQIQVSGSRESNITNFSGDVARLYGFDERRKNLYINASPENPTQRYLYSVSTDGKSDFRRLTPKEYQGVNTYDISPNGKYAIHTYSNSNTPRTICLISLPNHKKISTLSGNERYRKSIKNLELSPFEAFKVTTKEGIEMDGKLIKPDGFEAGKRYPVVYHTYGDPVGTEADDNWQLKNIYHHLLAKKGYVIVIMDNRGTPSLKGRDWRKVIYENWGIISSKDFALAARETFNWDFIDSTRTAFWGHSGGGFMALNLIFRYPDIFKTAVAISPVTDGLLYDNIYMERYMGLKSENLEKYRQSSPINQAKNLKGNLLIIHGTGDDNVHYQNTEMLIDELIKHNKQFRVMPYPNRKHGIRQGKNTSLHKYTLMTNFLLEMNPVGGR